MNEQTAKQNLAKKKAKKNMKHWVAVTLFAAIIAVFALWGVNPARMGGESTAGGIAVTVNDSVVTMPAYQFQLQNMEARLQQQLQQYPESIRGELLKQQQARLRTQVVGSLVMSELVYQGGNRMGVLAPDPEIRDILLKVPPFQENGRFLKERYMAFLQSRNLSTEDFEHQLRKDIVDQKLQELFVSAAAPSQQELKISQELGRQKVAVRFIEVKPEAFSKPSALSSDEVHKYLASNKADVEKYYKENQVEFTKPESVEARHILIKIDDKRDEAQALKIVTDLKKEATPANFAKLATQHSDDPGSKAKGGDLGEFQRGRMVPEFDKAAFGLKPGQISEPVKSNFGYHLILVTKKTQAGTDALEQAQEGIARKILARKKESEVLAKAKSLVEKGDKKEIESLVQNAGLKWAESGEFDFSSATIPKLGDGEPVISAILKSRKTSGLIPQLINIRGSNFIVDVMEWKQLPPVVETPESQQMLAYRKSSDMFEAWMAEQKAKASIEPNPRIMQQ
jgi:peptidyl-prolyl cis-trans isomerase D